MFVWPRWCPGVLVSRCPMLAGTYNIRVREVVHTRTKYPYNRFRVSLRVYVCFV